MGRTKLDDFTKYTNIDGFQEIYKQLKKSLQPYEALEYALSTEDLTEQINEIIKLKTKLTFDQLNLNQFIETAKSEIVSNYIHQVRIFFGFFCKCFTIYIFS